jgi:acyl carrier protein
MTATPSPAREMVHAALYQVASDRRDELDGLDPDADVWRELDLDSLDHLTVMTYIAEATNVDIAERDYPRLITMRQLTAHVERALG